MFKLMCASMVAVMLAIGLGGTSSASPESPTEARHCYFACDTWTLYTTLEACAENCADPCERVCF